VAQACRPVFLPVFLAWPGAGPVWLPGSAVAAVAAVQSAWVAAAQVQHEGPVLAPAQVWVGPAAVAAGC